jgi:hypothetical protein
MFKILDKFRKKKKKDLDKLIEKVLDKWIKKNWIKN